MFKNYFKTAWRNLVKDKQFSLLNLLGLSTGLACVLLIYLWVSDELSIDKFNTNDSRLYFAGIAILISCLGIFGLSAFTAQKRKKEIGIRKVIGASVSNVVAMLSKDFLVLVGLSLLIAFPVSWWLMNNWLQSFAYRISITPFVFVITGISVLLITLFTISFQSIKAAIANPVASLRTE